MTYIINELSAIIRHHPYHAGVGLQHLGEEVEDVLVFPVREVGLTATGSDWSTRVKPRYYSVPAPGVHSHAVVLYRHTIRIQSYGVDQSVVVSQCASVRSPHREVPGVHGVHVHHELLLRLPAKAKSIE